MAPKSRRVTASQVGQYAFCARAWWLGSVENCEPVYLDRLDDGRVAHERHGWSVALARASSRLAVLLVVAAALALAAWTILALIR